MREERHGVDAVGQRADVGPPGALRQPLRLERVGEVADEDRNRRARQDPPVDQFRGESEHAAAQRVDQQQLDEIVDGEAEEAVNVAANDPPQARGAYTTRGAGCEAEVGEVRGRRPEGGRSEVELARCEASGWSRWRILNLPRRDLARRHLGDDLL